MSTETLTHVAKVNSNWNMVINCSKLHVCRVPDVTLFISWIRITRVRFMMRLRYVSCLLVSGHHYNMTMMR